jgi:preprotein translocase subunit Sss1
MSSSFSVDGKEIVVRIIKYILEGSMVAIAVALIPAKKPSLEEVLTIALIAAATFSLLDMFAPSIGASARMGAGFGIGAGIAQWPAARPL